VATLLEVEHVTLRFGGVTALADVSFSVERGELFAIIGPNGAGKTSIFNCLNQVYRPQEGSIRLDGEELMGKRPSATARMGIARTFQNLGLFANLDVVDNLMLGRHHLMRTGFVSGMLWWGRAKREEIEHRAAVERVVDLLERGRLRRIVELVSRHAEVPGDGVQEGRRRAWIALRRRDRRAPASCDDEGRRGERERLSGGKFPHALSFRVGSTDPMEPAPTKRGLNRR
jgi:hypothetical protein